MINDVPFFSIIIPLFNCQDYIEQCLDSLLKQEFKNFEVIIIDDASSDNSSKRVSRYLEDNRFSLIKNEKNLGLSLTRNKGLDKARGDNIIFIDSDDFIESNSLRAIYQRMIQTNADVVLTKIHGFAELGVNRQYPAQPIDECVINNLDIEDFFLTLSKTQLGLSPSVRYICKRNIIEKNQLRFKNIFNEDALWSLELILNCRTVNIIYSDYYRYRLRSDSLSTIINFDKAKCLLCSSIESYNMKFKYSNMHEFIRLRSKHIYDRAIQLMPSLLPFERETLESFIAENRDVFDCLEIKQ